LVQKLKKIEKNFSFKEEELDYKQVIFNLNWLSNPAKPVPPQLVKVLWIKDYGK
jgi:hypothetical protein